MSLNNYVVKIQNEDKKTFNNDFNIAMKKYQNDTSCENNNDIKLIADFTEYSPLHNGHYHCMKTAKEKHPEALFVAIIPGLFERNGRGQPYILSRYARSEIAVKLGADICVEGPPMGIMGSGQYSLCLAKMFKKLNTDFIPRGYNPSKDFDEIIKRIKLGHTIKPKPYKIIDYTMHETILKGKLAEDNYVICSFTKSFDKIDFNFKDKFIFIPRIPGVSGTKIREASSNNDLDSVKHMLPNETIKVLKREIEKNQAPLHMSRNTEEILYNANNLSFDELNNLNFFTPPMSQNFIEKRENKPFEKIEDILEILPYGFSTHFKHRVLSILETKINSDIISDYIKTYPFNIRVLNYKNEHVLEDFKSKINQNRRLIINGN